MTQSCLFLLGNCFKASPHLWSRTATSSSLSSQIQTAFLCCTTRLPLRVWFQLGRWELVTKEPC